MFVHTAAVIGGEGGGSYSHAAELEAAGFCLGAGPNCMRLSSLHVEKWQVLSHNSATYTSIKDPTQTFTPPGRANIRTEYSTDFTIPADHRVSRVCAAAGDLEWAAGGRCLNFVQIETVPVAESEEGQAQVASIGSCRLNDDKCRQPGTTQWRFDGATCKVLLIPKGLTLVGIAGRAGDSWDQVSLLVGPWLPMGGWSPSMHKLLITPFKEQAHTLLLCLQRQQCSAAIQPLNKQVNECLVAALFDATFMASADDDVAAADDFVAAWVQQQVQEARAQCDKLLEDSTDCTHDGDLSDYLAYVTDDSSDDAD